MVVVIQIVLITLAIIVGIALTISSKTDENNQRGFSFRPVRALVGVVLFWASILLTMAVGQIESGSIGVVTRYGAVTGRTFEAGLYFVTPFVESVEVMDLQARIYGKPRGAGSKDLQEVQTTVAANYKLDPSTSAKVFKILRRDYLTRVVIPAVGESIKGTTANFNSEELLTKRPEIKSDIELSLRNRPADIGIIVETVSISDFEFSSSFQAAIEAKQVAA